MPRLVHMTWVRSQKRWTKMYKGTRYYVSTGELKTAPTMEASLLAANEWWEKKKKEIDQAGNPSALKKALDDFHGGEPACAEDYLSIYAAFVEAHKDKSLPAGLAQEFLGPVQYAQVQATGQHVKATLENAFATVENAFQNPTGPPPGNTFGTLARRWVAGQRNRIATGDVGSDRADSNRRCLVHFVDWIGEDTPVALDAAKWEDWFSYLAGQVAAKKWAPAHAHRIFGVSKRFVTYLWELDFLSSLPRNLNKREFKFKIPPKDIQIFTDDEIKRVYAVIRNQSRLHFLLMLNCGFNAADINALRHDEVDWEEGIITRRRTKTQDVPNAPFVRWKLWPQTFSELQKWRSADPEVVLLTNSGGRWIIEHQGDVSYSRSDCVASAMRHWFTKAKVKHPPKALRATAASKLGESPAYKFYVPYFLAHSPVGVSERHYRKPTDKEFFEALAWLEGALGLTPEAPGDA